MRLEQVPDLSERYRRHRLAFGDGCGASRQAWAAVPVNACAASSSCLPAVPTLGPLTAPVAPEQAPRVLGVEGFAFRKGRRYGTVLVDSEAARVVDVGAATVSPTGVPHRPGTSNIPEVLWNGQCGALGEPEGCSVTPGHHETV